MCFLPAIVSVLPGMLQLIKFKAELLGNNGLLPSNTQQLTTFPSLKDTVPLKCNVALACTRNIAQYF